MIGKLKGKLREIDGNQGLVETTSGVYYKLYLTPNILQRQKIDDLMEVYTFLNVKEDSLTLYGFDDKSEYRLFTLLLSVDGVGPKLAFVIISFTTPEKIIEAVTTSDHIFFSSIPGIGKKTAQKILLELSSKFDSEFQFQKTVLSKDDKTVVDALVSLGFDRRNSQNLLNKITKTASVEDKIRQVIKLLTQKK